MSKMLMSKMEVDCKDTLLIALLADEGDALHGKSRVGESLTVATCSVVEVLAASVFNAPDSEMDSVLLSSDLGSRARMDLRPQKVETDVLWIKPTEA